MRFLPVNLDALLVELDDLRQTLVLLASLSAQMPEGVRELVPAARTIMVSFDPLRTDMTRLAADIGGRQLDGQARQDGPLVQIPVHYNGEDLAEVAERLGISVQEVIQRHTGQDYAVAFTGFAPGFAYLAGGHPGLEVPRRTTPRTRVPAGSVALAGNFSAVYPQDSPGGWQLLGVTPLAMWDMQRDPPAVLQPSYRVRFVDAATLTQDQIDALCNVGVRLDVGAADAPEAVAAASTVAATMAVTTATAADDARRAGVSTACLVMRATGLQTLFQDRGRHGQAGMGISASGGMDQGALRMANRLLGNRADEACLEVAYGGLVLACEGDAVVAVTGAEVDITISSTAGARWQATRGQAIALGDGDVLSLGTAVAGARAYVAVRGGFDVAPVLGSCATDTLARVGPPALQRGDRLAVRAAPATQLVDQPAIVAEGLPRAGQVVVLDIVMGPRTDWFTQESVARLCAQDWRVTEQSNRIGMRLAGEQPLERTKTMELPSEGTATGAIQVPASGQPVLFLADHPLTGGYPVIATVATYHLDLAGQVPVNALIRFRPIRAFQALDVA